MDKAGDSQEHPDERAADAEEHGDAADRAADEPMEPAAEDADGEPATPLTDAEPRDATDAANEPTPYDANPGEPGRHDAQPTDAQPTDAQRTEPAPRDAARGETPMRDPGEKTERPHPYRHEPSPPEEADLDARRVTLFWASIATVLAVVGYVLQSKYGYLDNTAPQDMRWDQWTNFPLFAGLALLGFGFIKKEWARWFTMTGWVLFAAYWAMVARDLLLKEGQDYVNFVFALVGVYFFVYLAYHEWLSHLRKVDNPAVHFLNVTAFIAAGSYFLIARVTPLRVGLINIVGNHTKWMLDLFGQGEKKDLVFVVDKTDSQGPVTFWYPDTKYTCPDGSKISDHPGNSFEEMASYCTSAVDGWRDWFFASPGGEHIAILPVSIILACTAIQSIMLFVGLFAGTQASTQKKVYASLVVGAAIYVLNLVRNTGIIWFYGQGYASFWMMHNLIGKGGSLLAMVGIAFVLFRAFPEFFTSLVGVLDLQHRDGPIERQLKLGKKRPGAPPSTA